MDAVPEWSLALDRSFSVPRLSPRKLLLEAEDDDNGNAEPMSEERKRLVKLWIRYWNVWEREMIPEGKWWDRKAMDSLLSDPVILLKPEGIFKGKRMVLDEYENFAKRFARSGDLKKDKDMDRRLTRVIIDEEKRTTTAAYEVIIPSGILAEDEDEDGGGGEGEEGKQRKKTQQQRGEDVFGVGDTSVYSIAEVVKWNLEKDSIKEIHYYGSGVRLSHSSIPGKLTRARDHRKRLGGEEEDAEGEELGQFIHGIGTSGQFGVEEIVLNTQTVSDDRPLVRLSLKYVEALLQWNREVVRSLVSDSYNHLTAFGNSFHHFSKVGKVKGEVDSIYVDDRQKIVSIERKYVAGEHMTEIIDFLHWEEPGPQICRHSTYGFSWQAEDAARSLSRLPSDKMSSKEFLSSEDALDRIGSMASKRSRTSSLFFSRDSSDEEDSSNAKKIKSNSEPRVKFL